jgi:hypothetical protein
MRLRILFAVLCIVSSNCHAGVAFSVQMRRSQGVSTYKTWAEGRSFKAVVETSNDSDLSTGNFVISRDGGVTWIAASARWKRYLVLTPEKLRERLGTRPKPLAGSLQSLTVEKLPEQNGGMVAGYATRRHTQRVSVVLQYRSLWREVTRRMVVTETRWMAESIPCPGPELGVIMEESTGTIEIDRALALSDPKGFPMKRVIEIDVDGRREAASSVEVKSLAETRVEESVFAVPTNYKKH